MKLGLCFLIRDSINLEKELWVNFLKNVNRDSFGIYVHHKHLGEHTNFVSDLPNAKDCTNIIPTARGYPSLVDATRNLFLDAFNDGCDYAYLISGDMIPLCSFGQLQEISKETLFQFLETKDIKRYCNHCKKLLADDHFVRRTLFVWEKRYEEHYERNANSRIKEIAPSFHDYKKQFMFFGMNKESFLKIESDYNFPKYKKLNGWHWGIDEFYWINICNYLNIKYKKIDNLLFCNRDPIETQAEHIDFCNSFSKNIRKFFFARKIGYIDKIQQEEIINMYNSKNINL